MLRQTDYRCVGGQGYVFISRPGHPRADRKGHIQEHTVIAEAALGHLLPSGVEVHHVNGVTTANRPGNLVICQDAAYHDLLEIRTRAIDACGHASWRKCVYGPHYDDPNNMVIHNKGKPALQYCHSACRRAYNRKLRAGSER